MIATTPSPLGVLDPPLARAEPSRGAPIRIAGDRVALHADGRRGLTASYTRAGLLTGPIVLADARAANVVHAPGLLRRELVTPTGTVWETWIAPERLAGFAVQWERVGAATAGEVDLEISVDLAVPPGSSERWSVEGATLVVSPSDGAGAGVTLAVAPHARWSVDPSPSGARARARVRLGPDRSAVTLVVAERNAAGTGPSLAALGNLEAHLRRAYLRAAPRSSSDAGLSAHTGVAEIDDGLAWARHTVVAGRLAAPPSPAPPELDTPDPLLVSALDPAALRAWHALGALVSGEHDAAREFLADDPHHPLDLLAWAAWAEWTNGPQHLVTARAGLTDALARWGRPPGGTMSPWVAFLGPRLADAAEAAGDRTWAAALRAAPVAQAGPAARALPTVSTGPRRGATLDAIFGDLDRPLQLGLAAPEPIGGTAEPGPAALATARALYEAGRPDEGFPSLRAALGTVTRRGPTVDGLREAVTLWTFVTGLLGARSDAAFGRLRLRPALPAHWTRVSVRAIRLADTVIDVDFAADGPRHHWTFTPVEGAVPATLIFEPSLALRPPLDVRIDGRPATLDEHVRGDRVTMRAQLPLDSERSVTVEGSRSED